MIDKLLELPLQPAALSVYSSKFQLKTTEGAIIDKDVSATQRRVARALSAVEKTDTDKWYDDFLWAQENGAIPAGRITSNAGAEEQKPGVSLINCLVSDTIVDSIEGILYANYEAGISLALGSGIGYEFSTIRPKGSFVNGVGAKTSGVLPFMDIFDKMCFTISSAGGRRGAMMATFDIHHPEVLDFIRAKREEGRFTQFNLSVLITAEFIDAVKSNSDWILSFPISIDKFNATPDAEYIWRAFPTTKGYQVDNSGLVACEIYETLKAVDLWDTIMRSNFDYAEPGFILIDRMNELNPLSALENIRATNPCQPSTATVLTPEGIRTFNDIDVGSTIWSGHRWTTVTHKVANGFKPVYGYRTTQGIFLGTDKHRVVEKGVKIEVKKASHIDNSILPVKELINKELDPKIIMDGLYLGDGVYSRFRPAKRLCIGVNDRDYFDSEISGLIIKRRLSSRDEHIVDTSISMSELGYTYTRVIPNRYYSGDVVSKRSFLRGLFSANGSVVADGFRVTLKTTSARLCLQVQEMLTTVGITSYFTTNREKRVTFANGNYLCKESYDINITTDRYLFRDTIGFLQHYKNEKINGSIRESSNRPSGIILEAEYIDDMEVFDITVDAPEHTYWTGGLLVSNCAEQGLPPFGACLLGSINLVHFVINPFTELAEFDYERYIKVVRIFHRMLDNVVELSGLKLDAQIAELKNKRRHGMGYTGLGSTMVMLGIEYGSVASLEFTSKVTRLLTIEGYRVGAELAKEKGACPILQDGNNLESFMTSKFMKRIFKDSPDIEESIRNYGSRYTHCSSIAPTGSISLSIGNNVSNGIEPSFAHQYKRNIIVDGKSSKVQVDVFSFELLLYNKLMGKNIPIVDLPSSFIDTDVITARAHIDILAAAQYWIDSSISKTTNVPSDISFDDFKDIYLYAVERGCKGVSTYRPSGAYTGVLIKDSDLESTLYQFTLADGTTIDVYGDEDVEYDGDVHNAANLYHSISTGVYGKL